MKFSYLTRVFLIPARIKKSWFDNGSVLVHVNQVKFHIYSDSFVFL